MARNILVKLATDGKDETEKDLDEVAGKLDELGEKKPTATIRIDKEQAEKNLDEIIAKMEMVPREETIHLRVQEESAKLDAFIAKLAALKAEAANTDVGEDLPAGLTRNMASVSRSIDASRQRIAGLAGDLENLGDDGDKDVGRLTQKFTSWASSITNARGKLAGLTGDALGKIPLIGGLLDTVVSKVGNLAESLLPEAAQGFTGLLTAGLSMAAMGPILFAIVAAMGALVVSLGEALIGVAALAVGFLVALGPIVALLGIVFTKIKDIVSAQQTLKSDAANLKSAYDSQKQAVTELQQAEQNEARQRILALQAQTAAFNAMKDAENQTADAKLGVDQARLSLSSARLTLAAFKQELAGLGNAPGNLVAGASNVSVAGNFGQTQAGASGLSYHMMLLQYKEDLLAVKQAAQGVPDALQQVADSTANQATATQNYNLYLKEGLRAFPDYQSALNTVVTSQENFKRAADQVKAALLAQNQAIKHGASEATGFLTMWDKLKKTLGAVFGPAEAAVFKGIEEALGILAKHLKPLMPAFLLLGKAIGGAFVWWAKMITKPDNMALLVTLIKDAAGLTKSMSHWLGHGLKFIIEIATDSLPALIKIVGHWASQLAGITGKHETIKQFIDKCIASATTWWHRLQSIGGAVITIAGTFKTVAGVIHAILGPLEAIGKLLGIGKGGGIIAGIAVLAALKGGGGGGVLAGLLNSGGGQAGLGILGKLGLVAGAGAAGYGIGSELYSHSGAVRSAGGAVAGGVDSVLGIDSTNPNSYAGKEGLTSVIAKISKELATGIVQAGPGMGRQVTAAMDQRLIAILRSEGVTYKGPIAPPKPSSGGDTHHHWKLNQGDTIKDDQHFVKTVETKLGSLGGGVK